MTFIDQRKNQLFKHMPYKIIPNPKLCFMKYVEILIKMLKEKLLKLNQTLMPSKRTLKLMMKIKVEKNI